MRSITNTLHESMPAISQVTVQAALAGVNIVYKLAESNGMSLRVLIAYRFIFGAAIVVPLALIIERKDKPKLTWLVLGQAFLCGLLGGSLFQNLYGQSVIYTSATFVSAINNMIPAITLALALLFRLEKLKLKTTASRAKVIGIFTCIGGAMILIFYKGMGINLWETSINILDSKHNSVTAKGSFTNPILGAVFAICFCFSFAANLIIQAMMMKSYPRPYLATAMTLCMGGVQSTVFALCTEISWDAWKLGWNTNLLAASYMGIMGSGIASTLMTWGVKARGALYVSIFNPLMLILVVIFASLLLDEKLHTGSLLGGGIIICGLYVVLWGINKELKMSSVHEAVHLEVFQEECSVHDAMRDSIENISSIQSATEDSEEVMITIMRSSTKSSE